MQNGIEGFTTGHNTVPAQIVASASFTGGKAGNTYVFNHTGTVLGGLTAARWAIKVIKQ